MGVSRNAGGGGGVGLWGVSIRRIIVYGSPYGVSPRFWGLGF